MPRREPHPTIPHLYREVPDPSSAQAIYPYLRSQDPQQFRLIKPAQPALGKGLLADATRGGVSSLGGQAKAERGK